MTYTHVLAKLLSSSSQRNAFSKDKKVYLQSFNLAEQDSQILANIDVRQLNKQADALIGKRWFEVRGLLPDTCGRLGLHGRKLFFQYADTYWPQGDLKHLEDAYRFCRFLKQFNPAFVCDLEMNKMNFLRGDKRLWFYWVKGLTIRNRQKSVVQLIIRWPLKGLHVGILYFG